MKQFASKLAIMYLGVIFLMVHPVYYWFPDKIECNLIKLTCLSVIVCPKLRFSVPYGIRYVIRATCSWNGADEMTHMWGCTKINVHQSSYAFFIFYLTFYNTLYYLKLNYSQPDLISMIHLIWMFWHFEFTLKNSQIEDIPMMTECYKIWMSDLTALEV